MKTSNKGIELIKSLEGLRLVAYDDGFGNLTIGYGHCASDVYKGQYITQSEAENILKTDIEHFEGNVNKYANVYNFNQNEFDALVSFAFNIGSVDELLRNGVIDKKDITDRMLLYCHANGQVVEGLKNRRIKEVELFKTNDKTIEYYTNLLCEVLEGKHGTGEERKKALADDYKKIQDCINMIYKYFE